MKLLPADSTDLPCPSNSIFLLRSSAPELYWYANTVTQKCVLFQIYQQTGGCHCTETHTHTSCVSVSIFILKYKDAIHVNNTAVMLSAGIWTKYATSACNNKIQNTVGMTWQPLHHCSKFFLCACLHLLFCKQCLHCTKPTKFRPHNTSFVFYLCTLSVMEQNHWVVTVDTLPLRFKLQPT